MNKLTEFMNSGDCTVKEKILFIDVHNMIYRNVFVSVMQSPEENFTGFYIWRGMFLSSVFSSIKNFNPTKVIFSVDSKHNWRKEIYKEYKAQRAEGRDKSIVDFEKFMPIVNYMVESIKKLLPLYVLKIDRCESDDIIAVLTKRLSKFLDDELVIISSDKDFLQLQKNKNVKQYDAIQKKFIESINPVKDLEVKILTGDKGDNIPAIKDRCGPKTAEKLLNEGLEELLRDEEIKQKYLRNKKLIDFDEIPDDIIQLVTQEYENYKLVSLNVNDLWKWLLENKIKGLAEDLQTFIPSLKKLI